MRAVFVIGAVFAVFAFICMMLLGKELKKMDVQEEKNGVSNNEIAAHASR